MPLHQSPFAEVKLGGGMLRACLALVVCLWLSACATFDPHDVVFRGTGNHGNGQQMSVQKRAEAFDFVWKTIRDSYLDPSFNGVDWNAVARSYRARALVAEDDRTFWRILDRMTGELHDSHTRVESPQQYAEIRAHEGVSLAVLLQERDGQVVVERVGYASEAWLVGLRPGARMLSIEGQPALDWWHRMMARTREGSSSWSRYIFANREFNTGHAGDAVPIEFMRPDGSRVTTSIARNRVEEKPFVMALHLASGMGYLRLTSFESSVRKRAFKALETLRDTRGIILDLRDNGGGSVDFARDFASQFVNRPVDVAHVTTRSHKPLTTFFGLFKLMKPEFVLKPVSRPFDQPLVILVNAASASATELVAASLQGAGRAQIAGGNSCGCLRGYMGYANIPGGGALAYSEFGFAFRDGRVVEGVGLKPDLPAQPTLQDLADGRDPQFLAAQAWLEKFTRP